MIAAVSERATELEKLSVLYRVQRLDLTRLKIGRD